MDYVTFDRLCKANGTSATALAIKLGLSKGNTTSWKKGGNPSADILMKMADELNCTVDILLGRGTSGFLGGSEDEKSLFSTFSKLNDKDKIKVIERAETLAELAAERAAKERAAEQAKKTAKSIEQPEPDELGDDQPDEDNGDFYIDLCSLPASAGTGVQLDEGYTEPMRIVHTSLADRANYAVRVSGDSMEDKYFDGDIVLIETCPNIDIGEIGLFVVNDQGYIKQRGEDRLISLNPERDDIYIHESDYVSCRGRVLGKAEIIK